MAALWTSYLSSSELQRKSRKQFLSFLLNYQAAWRKRFHCKLLVMWSFIIVGSVYLGTLLYCTLQDLHYEEDSCMQHWSLTKVIGVGGTYFSAVGDSLEEIFVCYLCCCTFLLRLRACKYAKVLLASGMWEICYSWWVHVCVGLICTSVRCAVVTI